MPLGFVEIDYQMNQLDGKKRPARGVQIGRFAIRREIDGFGSPGLPEPEGSPWRVDHLPTGRAVAAFETFEDAYAFTDDISRFSKSDPVAKDTERLKAQIGPQVIAWMKYVGRPFSSGESASMKYIPYREWLAAQGTEWKPQRRRMKSLFR